MPEKLTGGLKLVEPNGTNLRFTELGPGVITPMVRKSTGLMGSDSNMAYISIAPHNLA